jgi:hypothetical protein
VNVVVLDPRKRRSDGGSEMLVLTLRVRKEIYVAAHKPAS